MPWWVGLGWVGEDSSLTDRQTDRPTDRRGRGGVVAEERTGACLVLKRPVSRAARRLCVRVLWRRRWPLRMVR